MPSPLVVLAVSKSSLMMHWPTLYMVNSDNKNNNIIPTTTELPDQGPQVMTELNNTEVYEGTVARFKCKFHGRPEPTIRWLVGLLVGCLID